jgi:hypothetical protein
VNPKEQTAQKPSSKTGLFATLRGLLHVAGSAARSRTLLAIPLILLAAVSALLAFSTPPALATGDANKPQCTAETESSPGFRPYLPDCRAYEMVTPPYKGSALVLEPVAVSENGGQVLTMAGGAFAGAGNAWWAGSLNTNIDAYKLTRTASGWQPTALTPPATRFPYSHMMAATPDLGTTLWGATTRVAFAAPSVNEGIYVRSDSGVFSLVGPGVAPEVAGEELLDPVNQQLTFGGASRGLTRLLFHVTADPQNSHSTLWPGDSTGTGGSSLYEYSYGGTPSTEPALVGVKNEGPLHGTPLNEHAELISKCNTALGAGQFGGSTYNAVSGDGETVFFTAGACAGAPEVNELYARVNGEHTVALSEPLLPAGASCTSGEPCFGAEKKEAVFEGASEDGSRVVFLSEQPLLNGVPAAGVKLYEARLQAGALTELVDVSADPTPGQSPNVQGVVRVSENGERVYFVAQSVLAGENAEHHSPSTEAGADNLYVYDTETRATVFVGTLLDPAEEASIAAAETKEQVLLKERANAKYVATVSVAEHEFERGEISEEREESIIKQANEEDGTGEAFINENRGVFGPTGTLGRDLSVWANSDARPVQATPNGGFLLFLSSAHLTADDESRLVPQLFEYDAAREKLTRISIGQGGSFEHDGAVETFRAAPSIPAVPFVAVVLPTATQSGTAMSGDGSRVFFTSAGRLTPEAVPGDTNVYEYREGNVYLISDGRDASTTESTAQSAVTLFGVDSSGGNVFFTSADALVPQDAESQMVLYDAREAGGFPAPVLAPGCVGETCRGSSGGVPRLGVAGSASEPGGGNLAPPSASVPSRPKTAAQIRAEKLAKALKACHKDKKKSKRKTCERAARKKYATKASKTSKRKG